MNTNQIFQKIIQSIPLDTPQVKNLFALSGIELEDKDLANLLKAENQPGFEPMPHYVLALFLDKLIDMQRGPKSNADEPLNKHLKLTNNDLLKKLRVAFNLHEQDVRDALKLATIELTKSDLSALFRKPGNPHYKACDDELLLDFIEGLGKWLQQKREGESQ